MPYCALSENGAQCQGCSWEPSARGALAPPQPGSSSLVRRGRSPGSNNLYLTICMGAPRGAAGLCAGYRKSPALIGLGLNERSATVERPPAEAGSISSRDDE